MADGDLLTIEQLAARTGLTVRNIRSHVTRGLLPPPHLKGRTGYYGDEHVARLQLITGLQQQGFNLAAIQKLVTAPLATTPERTIAFYRTALGPWLPEPPEDVPVDELAGQFGLVPDEALLQLLAHLDVVEPLTDGRVRVLNPTLLRVGRELAALGFGVDDLLGVLRVLLEHSRSVADAFVQMFLDVQWQSYVEAGMPPERLDDLRGVIEQLQPLASQAVVAAFQQAMTAATGQAFEEQTELLRSSGVGEAASR